MDSLLVAEALKQRARSSDRTPRAYESPSNGRLRWLRVPWSSAERVRQLPSVIAIGWVLLFFMVSTVLSLSASASPSEDEVREFIEMVNNESTEAVGGEILGQALGAGFTGIKEMLSSIAYSDWTGAATAYAEGDPAGAQRWFLSGLAKAVAAKAAATGATVVLGAGTAPVAAGVIAAVLTQVVIDRYYMAKDLHEAEHRTERLAFYQRMLSEFERQSRQQQDLVYALLQELLAEDPPRYGPAKAVFDDHRELLQRSQEPYRLRHQNAESSVRTRYANMPREGWLTSGIQEDYLEFLIQAERTHYYRHFSYLSSLIDEMDKLFPELSRSDPVRVAIHAPQDAVRVPTGDLYATIDAHATMHLHWLISSRSPWENYSEDLQARLLSSGLHSVNYEEMFHNGVYYHEWLVADLVYPGGLSSYGDPLSTGWYMEPSDHEVEVTCRLYLVTDKSVSLSAEITDHDRLAKVLLSEDTVSITFVESQGGYASVGAKLHLPYSYEATENGVLVEQNTSTARFEFDVEDRTLWNQTRFALTGTSRWPDEHYSLTVSEDGMALSHLEFSTFRDYGDSTLQMQFSFRNIPLRYKADLGPHAGHLAVFWAKGEDLRSHSVVHSTSARFERTTRDASSGESVLSVILSELKEVSWLEGYVLVQLATHTLAELNTKANDGDLSQAEIDEIEDRLRQASHQIWTLFAEDQGDGSGGRPVTSP